MKPGRGESGRREQARPPGEAPVAGLPLAAALPFQALLLALGALQILAHRHQIWLDGVSYLELGEAYLRRDWSAAANGCWSPLYAWLLALAQALLRPGPATELLVMKAVNFAIFAGALLAFHLLLDATARLADPAARLSRRLWLASGYALFGVAALHWNLVYRDSPDLAVAALVFLAEALVLRAAAGEDGWGRFALLGLTLAVAGLAKTVMLVLAPVFVLAAALSPLDRRRPALRAAAHAALAILVFALFSAPFVAYLSAARGRLTIGEAGRLNYAWYVGPGDIPDIHWQGEPPGSGNPLHPTRRISLSPPIYEFAAPVAGTYPPWYDPSYWNEGLRPRFVPARQLSVLGHNLAFALRRFGLMLAGAVLAAALASGSPRRWLGDVLRGLARGLPILLPALAGIALYLVAMDITWEKPGWGTMQTRYIAPFVVLLFLGVLLLLLAAVPRAAEASLERIVLVLTLVACLLLAVHTVGDAIRLASGQHRHIQWQVARALGALGVRPGDTVALVGTQDHYWARLAGVRVVAEAPEIAPFWAAYRHDTQHTLALFAPSGARALVSLPLARGGEPVPASLPGWTRLGETDYYARLLSAAGR